MSINIPSQNCPDIACLFRATVHIQVNDINEYAPVFKEKSYKATVIEGKKYDSILKVEAVDADCSFQFSQICNYEIVTPDVPFTVDKDGENSHLAALCLSMPEGKRQCMPKSHDCIDTHHIDPYKQSNLEFKAACLVRR